MIERIYAGEAQGIICWNVAPAVRALPNPLEPVKADTGARGYGDPVGQSEEWGFYFQTALLRRGR